MHRLSIALSFLLVTTFAVAQEAELAPPLLRGHQHLLLSTREPLTDEQRAELAAQGVKIQKAIGEGRFVVSVASDAAVAGGDNLSFEAISPERKLHRTARREAARGKAFAELNVIFQDDVTIDDARAAIQAVGGALDDPLQTEFSVGHRIAARIPATALDKLAADDKVFTIVGPFRLKQESENATNATLHHVTELYSAPYNLSGAGVVVSLYELAAGQESHPDFGGRLTVHATGGQAEDIAHATHVAGTILGSGAGRAEAKGMAWAATGHQWDARGANADIWLKSKKDNLVPLGVVADNNSWGYVLGWTTDSSGNNVWEDTDIYFGAYDLIVAAPIDKLSRTTNVLFVHSAGNDGTPPQLEPPAPHRHVDDNLDPIPDKTWCYSADGSGNDCPTPLCTAGPQYCETTRHLKNAPWTTVGVTASAKNIITVGAIDVGKNIIGFSSRGPARDGRIKPEVVARGLNVMSTLPTSTWGRKSGTSMASPTVTGIATILTEQYRKTFNGANPPPHVMKALIIAGTEDAGPAGPDYTYGFGSVNAKNAADLIIADSAQGNRIRVSTLQNGGTYEVPVTLTSPQNLRVVLNWPDPEIAYLGDEDIALKALVNDLDVKVIDPAGNTVLPYVLDKNNPSALATRGVNTTDPIEMIDIPNAAAGSYRVIVTGTKITEAPPQQFVLVVNAPVGTSALPPCTDVTEPNSASSPYGNIPSGQVVTASICEATDVDVFRFEATKAGTVSVVVTSTGTPLKASLIVNGTTVATQDIGTSGSQTLTATVGAGSTPVQVRIEAAGALGTLNTYSIKPTYPFTAGARSRSVRH